MVSTSEVPEGEMGAIEHFQLNKVLGEGMFGVGYRAQAKTGSDEVCVKLFKDLEGAITEKTFKVELQVGYAGLNHPGVLKMMGAGRNHHFKNNQTNGEKFFIVSEIADNGELFDYVQEAEGIKEEVSRTLFKQIMDAIGYIHKKGVAHRDLKLENIFLDSKVRVKVADFGLMKVFSGPNAEALKTKCGTQNYMAPELSTKESYEGPPVDIFACGVMLFMMLTSKQPFNDANDIWHQRLVAKPQFAMQQRSIEISDEAIDLIAKMTAIDPNDRFTIEQIEAHPWMQGTCAPTEDIIQDFEGLEEERQNEMEIQQEARQKAIRSASGGACRKMGSSEEELHPNQDEKDDIDALFKIIDNSEHKHILQKGAKRPFGSFYTSKHPALIFEHLWGYLASKGFECNSNTEAQALEFSINESEFGDKLTKIQVQILEVLDEEVITEDKKYRVNLQMKEGDRFAYAKFVKKTMNENLKMFEDCTM